MANKIIFPNITRFPFHTEQGNFFQHIGDGIWKRVECYLPASPHTYGCDTMEQVADKFFTKLISAGGMAKRGLSPSGARSSEEYRLIDGEMVNQNNPTNRLQKV